MEKSDEGDRAENTGAVDTKPEAGPSGFFQRASERIEAARAARESAAQRAAAGARYGEYGRGFAREDPRYYANGAAGYGRIPDHGAARGFGDLSRGDERGWAEAPAGAYRDDRDEGLAMRAGPWARDPKTWAGRPDAQPRFVGHERSGYDRTGASDEPPYGASRETQDERYGRAETGAVRSARPTYAGGVPGAQRDDAHEQREHDQQAEGMFRRGGR